MRRFTNEVKWLAGALVATVAVGTCCVMSASASAATHFKGTIKLAIVNDLTGPSSIGSGIQGTLAYLDSVNAKGGVDGYKLVASEYDSASVPATGVQAVRRAIAAKPTAILSESFAVGSALQTMANTGLPVVGDGTTAGWSGHKTLFSILGDQQTYQSDAPLVILKKYAHATKIALFGSSYAALSQQALVHQASKVGVKIVLQLTSVPLVPNSADFLQAAEQIKAAGVQGVVGSGSEGLSELQVDLDQIGSKAKVLANDEYTKPTTGQDGLLFSQQWANPYVTNDPGMNQYKAAMQKFGYGGLIATNVWTPLRWAQAELMVQALTTAGPPFSKSAVVEALSKTKNFTADGVIAPASFPAYQNGGGHCQGVMEVIDAKWVSLANGTNPFVCGDKAVLLK